MKQIEIIINNNSFFFNLNSENTTYDLKRMIENKFNISSENQRLIANGRQLKENDLVFNKIITFLGVTFKANTDDMRDSSSLSMIPALSKKGAKIRYFDPTGYKKEFSKLKNVQNFENIKDSVQNTDLVIIHTEWNEFKFIDFKKIVKKNNFKIYDMRNIYDPKRMKLNNIKYFAVGRSV